MVRRVEAVAAEIQPAILSEGGVVADGILIQDLLIRRIQADAQRIDLRKLGRLNGLHASVGQLHLENPCFSVSDGTARTCATLLASMRCSQLTK